jgi:hypothetical protein
MQQKEEASNITRCSRIQGCWGDKWHVAMGTATTAVHPVLHPVLLVPDTGIKHSYGHADLAYCVLSEKWWNSTSKTDPKTIPFIKAINLPVLVYEQQPGYHTSCTAARSCRKKSPHQVP